MQHVYSGQNNVNIHSYKDRTEYINSLKNKFYVLDNLLTFIKGK